MSCHMVGSSLPASPIEESFNIVDFFGKFSSENVRSITGEKDVVFDANTNTSVPENIRM